MIALTITIWITVGFLLLFMVSKVVNKIEKEEDDYE